jgi:hypothetical protein
MYSMTTFIVLFLIKKRNLLRLAGFGGNGGAA